jgi:membrane protein
MNNIFNALHAFLWEKDLSTVPGWQAGGIKLLRIFQAVIRDLKSGMLTLRAMSLVYTTLLSLVPLLAVSFSVLKGFGVNDQLETVLNNMLAPLGEQSIEITKYIIGFVNNVKVGVLGALGLGLLLYTVISLVQKIESAFNFTWRIDTSRNMTQRFSDYLSVIMVGPVLVFTAMGITGTISNSDVLTSLTAIAPLGFLIAITSKLLPYVLVIAAFTFIYILVPNTRVRFRSALVGGIIAGILWETTGWLFASFIAGSGSYTAVYSGFAILMIFMIWLYLSWLILLIGASIAFYYQNPSCVANHQQALTLSCRLQEKTALMAMYQIAKNFHEDKPAWNHDQLTQTINIDSVPLQKIMDSLVQANLIILGGDDGLYYIPAHSLEHISIKTILDTVRSADETPYLSVRSIKTGAAVEQVFTTVDTAISDSLNKMSLRDLVLQTDT